MNQIRTNTNFAKKQNPQTYLNNDKYNNPKSETCMQGFSWWGGTGGIPVHYPKNWGILNVPCPPLFWTKNAGFVIFRQFLVILPKLTPTSWLDLGNPGMFKPLG